MNSLTDVGAPRSVSEAAAAAPERVPRRVAAIVAAAGISGPGRQLAALAVALRQRSVDLHVLILWRSGHPRPAYADVLERLGIPYHFIEDRGPLDVGVFKRAREILASIRPDLVQTHGYKATAIAWALRQSGAQWPWVGCFHGWTSENAKARFYHWLDHRMLAHADRIVVMSQLQARGFSRHRTRVRVVYNAVVPTDEDSDDREAIASLLRSLPRPRCAVIGRLSPEKGVDVFLRACAEVRHRGLIFSAVIAGDGPLRRELGELRDSLGLAQIVAFAGEVRSISELYRWIDLLVIPSRSEGLPNVLLEALAADRRVLSTEVGAVPEVLSDPAAGRTVPTESVSSLAQALAEMLVTADTETEQRARAQAAQRFSLEQRAAEHLAIYDQAAATRLGTRR